MKRNPAPKKDLVRGNASNLPFLPGGIDQKDLISYKSFLNQDESFPLDDTELLTVAPGMDRGMIISNTGMSDTKLIPSIQNILDFKDDFLLDLLKEPLLSQDNNPPAIRDEICDQVISNEYHMIDEIIPVMVTF